MSAFVKWKAIYYNSAAGESRNNVDIEFRDRRDKILFGLSRIGENTLFRLCTQTPILKKVYGDLRLDFLQGQLRVYTADEKLICHLAGDDFLSFVEYFGHCIGYSTPEIEQKLGVELPKRSIEDTIADIMQRHQ